MDEIKKLRQAYKIIFRRPDLLLQEALARTMEEIPNCAPVATLVNFFTTSKRSVVRMAGDDEE